MDISLLLTHKGVNESRLSNARCTLGYYRDLFPESEIIFVEQDSYPRFSLDSSLKKNKVDYLFAFNPGMMNKSWGLNLASIRAKGKVIVCLDTDILAPKAAIEVAYELILKGDTELVTPYGQFYDLPRDVTEAYWYGRPFNPRDVYPKRYADDCLLKIGGIMICDRDVYLRMHGYNEHFRGWGGEDDEFIYRALSTGFARWGTLESYCVHHLFHDRDLASTPDQNHYPINLHHLEKIKYMPKSLIHDYILGLPFGEIDKYTREYSGVTG